MLKNTAESVAGLPDGLAAWMSQQRWYASKGSEPRLERLGGWSVDHSAGAGWVRIETHYILDRQANGATLYQVPLTIRQTPLEAIVPIFRNGDQYVYDGPHDVVYAQTVLDLVGREAAVGSARGHRQPGARPVIATAATVLRGEQSNTSIICAVQDGVPVIIKVFRALHHGDNPDVVLQSAIAAAGSELVPISVGYLSGEWSDRSQENGTAHGHLAFAQEFLAGAEDAWRIAIRAAALGEDFSLSSHELGVATAQVHATLAAAMGTREATDDDIERILRSMRARVDRAIREIPSLEELRPNIQAAIDAARTAIWPALQRIHGDYHLGQVLSVPNRGWVLVDFEGEPLRAMTERSELDVTLRDIAGMLRSFDYAAGSVAHSGTADTPEWAAAARRAFVDGYVEAAGRDLVEYQSLLDAFELDKALYEAVYEARNRPAWIGIPLEAIVRLTSRRDSLRGGVL